MKFIFGILLSLALLIAPVSADQSINVTPLPGAPTDCSVSVGTAAVQILAPSSSRRSISLQNLHATQTISFSFTTTTPTTGAAGTFTLAAGARWENPITFMPNTALWAIASGATTVLSCMVF